MRERETDRQTDRQTDRRTGGEKDSQTDRQAERERMCVQGERELNWPPCCFRYTGF